MARYVVDTFSPRINYIDRRRSDAKNHYAHLSKDGTPEFRVARNRMEWYRFPLCRGHIYGKFGQTLYVYGHQAGRKPNTIMLYVCRDVKSSVWRKTDVAADSILGRIVLAEADKAQVCSVDIPEAVSVTYRNKRPETMPQKPHVCVCDNYVDEMIRIARSQSQGATWTAAVTWKEA